MEASKVGEHALGKAALGSGLVLHDQQKERLTPRESCLDHDIGLVALALSDVGEDLFIQKLNTRRIEVGGYIRQKRLDKLDKERREQLLKKPVVVYRFLVLRPVSSFTVPFPRSPSRFLVHLCPLLYRALKQLKETNPVK